MLETRLPDGRVAIIGGAIGSMGQPPPSDAAATLESLGHLRRAVDAWADAAVMAMRAGRSSAASERVRAITADTGLHPLPD